MLKIYKQAFMKAFDFTGRATRKEFWVFSITAYILVVLLAIFTAICTSAGNISETSLIFVNTLAVILAIILIFPSIALAVRRLHDVGLSGFWLLYLNPTGIAIVFVVYLLSLDNTVDNIIERVKNVGSVWVGWLLAIPAWLIGATAALFLLTLYKGKEEDNEYGPNPYV